MNKGTHSLKWVLLDFIQRCNDLRSFKQIHAQLLTSALVANDLVVTKAANFFGKHVTDIHYPCNFLKQFDWSLSSFPCNLIISGYGAGQLPWAAILIYRWVVSNGFVPDVYTVPAVLKSCAKFSGIAEVRQFHTLAMKTGLWCDIYVQNNVVHVYSICGNNVDAGKVFDEMLVRDVVSWTGLISGYVKAGMFNEAIALFLRMDVEPNVATFVSTLGACGKLGCLNLGKGIHGLVSKYPHGKELAVSNTLVDMYMKCESVTDAKRLFHEIPEKDIVSWTSMISGLVQCQFPQESLDLFNEMQDSSFEPDGVILTSVLSACASLGLLDYGRWVHEYIDRNHIKWDVYIGTSLVDMYAKCGCIEMAQHTFDSMPSKNIRTWNAYIGGLAINGHGQEALKQFGYLVESGTRPNEVTFLAVFTACCHCGLVDEGRSYFNQMRNPPYNLSPWLEHYGCMVDLLCRAELVQEAMELIKKMPMPPDVQILGALLSAFNTYGNVGLTPEMLKSLSSFECQESGVYVLLSNLYATNKKWAEVRSVRTLMKEKGISKAPGSSIIRVDASTETKEEVKTVSKAATEKKALAKAPDKPLPQMMEGDVIPSLKAILEAQQDLSDIDLVFLDNKGAKKIVAEGGSIPKTASTLRKIPGIGDYTLGAIASIAFKEAVPVVDGNVIRVIARLRAVSENPKDSAIVKKFWEIAAQLVDPLRPGDFNQSVMELGATVCTPLNPSCSSCPASEFCHALSIVKQDSTAAVTDYPVKGVKVKQRSDFSAVCVVELLGGEASLDKNHSSRRFVLVKRPNEGLLAGLWEFPSVLLDGETAPLARRKATDYFLKKNLKIDIRKTCDIVFREDVGEFVHIFSHIRLKLYVELLVLQLKGKVDDLFESEDEETITWKCVDSNALSSMGLTTSVRKAYDMVQKFKQKRHPFNQVPTKKRNRRNKKD